MAGPRLDVLRGTLDLLILRALSWGELHGFEIARWIAGATADVLVIEEGSLYPALHRLEGRGLVAAEWGVSDRGRRARFYQLTRAGRSALKDEISSWERFAHAVASALAAPRHAAGAER